MIPLDKTMREMVRKECRKNNEKILWIKLYFAIPSIVRLV